MNFAERGLWSDLYERRITEQYDLTKKARCRVQWWLFGSQFLAREWKMMILRRVSEWLYEREEFYIENLYDYDSSISLSSMNSGGWATEDDNAANPASSGDSSWLSGDLGSSVMTRAQFSEFITQSSYRLTRSSYVYSLGALSLASEAIDPFLDMAPTVESWPPPPVIILPPCRCTSCEAKMRATPIILLLCTCDGCRAETTRRREDDSLLHRARNSPPDEPEWPIFEF